MSWINYCNCLAFWKWHTLFSIWNSPLGRHSGRIRMKDKLWPLDQSWAIPQACCAHTPSSMRQASCTSLLVLWGITISSFPQTWDDVLLWPWRNYSSPSLCLSMLLLSTRRVVIMPRSPNASRDPHPQWAGRINTTLTWRLVQILTFSEIATKLLHAYLWNSIMRKKILSMLLMRYLQTLCPPNVAPEERPSSPLTACLHWR